MFQANGTASNVVQPGNASIHQLGQAGPLEPIPISRSISISDVALGQWDASSHIVDFVRSVVKDGNSHYGNLELSEVLSSLDTLVQSVGRPLAGQQLDCGLVTEYKSQVQTSLPPLKAAVEVLRWAKGW